MSAELRPNPALESVLAALELQRKEIVANKLKGWAAIILGLIAMVAISSTGQLLITLLAGAAAIIPGIVILSRITEKKGLYKLHFKHDVIGAAMRTIDTSMSLTPNEGITEAEFRHAQLFTATPDRYHTEDLVNGKAGKTSFYFAEVHAEYKTETHGKNGKQTHWHEILKGIMFAADFNKHFNGVTVVRPKDLGASVGAWFSKHIFSVGSKDLVQLENEDFNKTFVTYSTDQIEARYILTPALMEKILALNSRSAYTISASFVGSNLYIAFPLNRNYFEPPIFRTLLKPDLLDNDLAVLRFMYDIVQELDLNTRIWTKL